MSQVLDFIKAHTFALACAVVAILGLVAFFIYPIPGMFEQLRGEVKGRETVYGGLKQQIDASRTLPVVQLDVAEPQKLEYFPTNRIIEQGKAMLVKLSDESKAVLEAAIQRNKREPLVPNALPNGSPIDRQAFLDAYKVATAQVGKDADKGIIRRVLHGSLPPSAEELAQLGSQRAAQIAAKMLQYGPNNQPTNQPEVDKAIADMKAALPMKIRTQRAYDSTIFVSPDAVDIHPGLRGTQLPDQVTVFNGQFSLWIQSMVFEALVEANKGAKNVYEAPVKHLVKLAVPMNFVPGGAAAAPAMGFGSGGEGGGDPAAAAAPAGTAELKPDPAAPIAPKFDTDPLGYNHNPLFDPIRVQMLLRVDVSKLPQVLAAMQTAKLLKIKNVNLRTVDMGVALSQGYVYDKDGKTPLVEVLIDADVLVLRQWLVGYMPDAVKRYFSTLGVAAAPAV